MKKLLFVALVAVFGASTALVAADMSGGKSGKEYSKCQKSKDAN